MSGYAGRLVDTFLMGATDAMLALPTLIVILGVRAAFPLELPMTRAALLLLLIFALTGWAEMARLTRGLVLSFRKREFVIAAVALGGNSNESFVSPHSSKYFSLAANAGASAAANVLACWVALSYLGVGLHEPEPSLGNMLTAAGDLDQLLSQPFSIMSPAIAVLLFTLSVRLIGKSDAAL